MKTLPAILGFFVFSLFFFNPSAMGDTIYDSHGFEGPAFAPGALNGQDGWTAYGSGSGIEPMIVTAPDPVVDSQAVRLEVSDLSADESYLEMPIPDLLTAGYDFVTVSFDIYRQTDAWVSNLWWYWFDAGTPTYGLQWDEANGQYGGTYPFGWDGTSVPNIMDRYVTVKMEWDFHSGVASGYYDGQLVTTVNISGIASLTGWAIYLGHDEATGSGPDVAWIDNFKITATSGPRPDIKVDGQDGPLSIPSTQAVTMTISLDPVDQQGVASDWWILARKNGAGVFSWTYPGRWWVGLRRAYNGPLINVSNFLIHNGTIPVGSWEFAFAVDALDNQFQGTYMDKILVTSY